MKRDRIYLALGLLLLFAPGCPAGPPAGLLPFVIPGMAVTGTVIVLGPIKSAQIRDDEYVKCVAGGGDDPSSAHIYACCERWLKPNGAQCVKGTDP